MAGSGTFSQADAAVGFPFSHASEQSHPYRYDVALPAGKLHASVTATSALWPAVIHI